jgi:glucose-1-phosphate cytidylyltransferase
LDIAADGIVNSFLEKPAGDGAWINAGYFVCEPQIFDYLSGDDAEIFERKPIEKIVEERQLHAFKHDGFWKPMDTLRDKTELNTIWDSGTAPWMIW